MAGGSVSPSDIGWSAGPPIPAALRESLEESRRRGLLGPTDLEQQVLHAQGFSFYLNPGDMVLDLGSGGGLPGLVLAVGRPDLTLVLLDAAARRARFLERAIDQLGLATRVSVMHSRAEDAGRLEEMREQFDVVVSRSFGPPGVTAECARPFLGCQGRLVVSEPPSNEPVSAVRWPADGLRSLGMAQSDSSVTGDYQFVSIVAESECPERFPRRSGVASKRPLF